MQTVKIRQLTREDLNKPEFYELLSELSVAPKPDEFYLDNFFESLYDRRKTILVLEEDGVIVSTGSLFLEHKLIRNLGRVAHIEDIVTKHEYRNKGYGTLLINELVKIAKECDCYKVILDAAHHNTKFYEDCGFRQHEVCMRLDLNGN